MWWRADSETGLVRRSVLQLMLDVSGADAPAACAVGLRACMPMLLEGASCSCDMLHAEQTCSKKQHAAAGFALPTMLAHGMGRPSSMPYPIEYGICCHAYFLEAFCSICFCAHVGMIAHSKRSEGPLHFCRVCILVQPQQSVGVLVHDRRCMNLTCAVKYSPCKTLRVLHHTRVT